MHCRFMCNCELWGVVFAIRNLFCSDSTIRMKLIMASDDITVEYKNISILTALTSQSFHHIPNTCQSHKKFHINSGRKDDNHNDYPNFRIAES